MLGNALQERCAVYFPAAHSASLVLWDSCGPGWDAFLRLDVMSLPSLQAVRPPEEAGRVTSVPDAHGPVLRAEGRLQGLWPQVGRA